MKEIVHEYESLWKQSRLKKNLWETFTAKEKGLLIIAAPVFMISAIYILCARNTVLNVYFGCFIVLLASAFFLMYELQKIQSKVFRREEQQPTDWFEKLDRMLSKHNLESEEAINGLLSWCDNILTEETAIKKFTNNLEKILSTFIVPTVISVECINLDGISGNQFFYRAVLDILTMLCLGIVIYIAFPLVAEVDNERNLIKYFKRDLTELQIYNKRNENNESGQNKMGSTVGTSEE